MLGINPEIVCELILRIREFQSQEEVALPEIESRIGDIYHAQPQVLADYQDDLTYQEVEIAIRDLEPDQQYWLIALILIGRGDYDRTDLDAATEEAQDIEITHIPQFILALPQAADFLEESLLAFGYRCEV